jgi:hypothetical protein
MEAVMISTKLLIALKLSEKQHYKIAHEAGLHPSTLSKIITGIEKVKHNDERVISIGKVLGLSDAECFEDQKREKGFDATRMGQNSR